MIPNNLVNHKINQNTIKEWFDTFYASLCRKALRLVKQEAIAEDIVQNTFVKIWQKRNHLSFPDVPEAFLKQMVFNESIDWIRKNKKLISVNDEELPVAKTYESPIDKEGHTEQLRIKINEVISELPPRCHTIFVLSRFENLSYEEIANHLNISVKTVENQMSKAIKHIRQNFPKELLPVLLFYSEWIN